MLSGSIVLGTVLLFGAVGAPAVAAPAEAVAPEPIFAEGDCVVYRVADGTEGGASCAGADLTGTRFGEADFRNADLTGATFAGGDVQGAKFTGATLTGADFTGTRIVGADFSGAGILPAGLTLEADGSGTAPVPLDPVLPTGLAVDGCAIAGEPVTSGQAFPIGDSGILCTLSTSFEGAGAATATALVTVQVTASATAPPTEEPLFTPVPVTQGPNAETPNTLMIAGFIGGAVLVAGGIAAFVFANRRPKPRA
ncbi:MAG: pentapeptide repeat-containing protein [Herbiconiux sp.]|nr:pentapeptide repeat-containing protein [Herbiconiux sp.]